MDKHSSLQCAEWQLWWDIWKGRDPRYLSPCDWSGLQNQGVCVLYTQELLRVRHQDPMEKTSLHICEFVPHSVLRTQQDQGTVAELRNE